MFVIIWNYEVSPSRADEFVAAYGPDGDWAKLFRRSPDFIGLDLIADHLANVYTTIDRWRTEAAWQDFMEQNGSAYHEMDRRLEQITTAEQLMSRGVTID